VWIAEIRVGNNEPSIVMATAPRPESSASEGTSAPLAIHKALLWTDENRMLDVAVPPGTPPVMIVLEPEAIGIFTVQNSRWQLQQRLEIVHARPWPRDLRGRLVLRKDHLFDVYLPGVFCQSTATAPLGLKCRESDDPWPLTTGVSALSAFFAANRNF